MSNVEPAQPFSLPPSEVDGQPTRCGLIAIVGRPNVGKSTLMNALAGRKAAKTGDEPGVTKVEQKIMLADDFQLYDTPGMLWPKIMVPESGYKLAASGAVGRNAFDETEVGLVLLHYLKQHYRPLLEARYKLGAPVDQDDDEVLLSEIGRKRGAMLGGGRVNLQKAAEILIYEFRQGVLGQITLETPEEFAQWCARAEAADELREQRLAESIVDLMRPCVQQVFALEINLRTAEFAAPTLRQIQGAWTTDKMRQVMIKLTQKLRVVFHACIQLLKIF